MNNNKIVSSFHFRVLFKGLKEITDIDSRFQSVSGIQGALQQETDKGKSLVTTVFQPVILRRGMLLPKESVLLQWILKGLNNAVLNPLPEVLIEVLDENHQPAISIVLKSVSVRSWTMGELNAEKSGLLMEEIQLDYKAIEMR
ncbi:MAG: phage tail protein [Chitinophagaceae bacterium]